MAKFTGKKAYQVSEDHDGRSIIVFAQHNVVARREGATELNEEFEYVECKRAPEFDRFVDKGYVPQAVLLEAGWWASCHGPTCDKRVEAGYILDQEDRVFCSQACAGAAADQDAANGSAK